MRSHSGFLVPSVMETRSGRLRLFAASDFCDSEMDSDSDSEMDCRKDDCDDEVRWAYVETMLDADAVKPDKRLRKKTPDTFTMAPLEIQKKQCAGHQTFWGSTWDFGAWSSAVCCA